MLDFYVDVAGLLALRKANVFPPLVSLLGAVTLLCWLHNADYSCRNSPGLSPGSLARAYTL